MGQPFYEANTLPNAANLIVEGKLPTTRAAVTAPRAQTRQTVAKLTSLVTKLFVVQTKFAVEAILAAAYSFCESRVA